MIRKDGADVYWIRTSMYTTESDRFDAGRFRFDAGRFDVGHWAARDNVTCNNTITGAAAVPIRQAIDVVVSACEAYECP